MKNLWILLFVVALGFIARAAPLENEIKNFTDALKTTDASKADAANPMMAARMPALAAELESSAMAPGGEANLEAMVKQMMAMNPSEAVQKTGKALLAELVARRKMRVDALAAKVNGILARVPEILIKAQKTQELDAILGDLQKVQAPQGGMYGNDPESQAAMNRVNSAYQFVAQWQDYLSARNSGNIQEAQNSLRNLSNSRPVGETMLVPRSEILARTVELSRPVKTASAAPGAPPPASPAVDVGSILDRIKTLDDMQSALHSLKAVTNQGNDYMALSQMARTYADAQNGLPITLISAFGGDPAPELGRIRSMLLIYLLPRFIGSDALKPNPSETVVDYLKRSMEAAEAKQNWLLLQRIIEAKTLVAGTNGYPSGTRSFLAGLNQETAGQFAQAVGAYQSALREPDDYFPSEVVGDRLAAIKKDHPAEFDEGMKRFLNPPPPPVYLNPYPYGMRPGMPGYPNPAAPPAAAPASTNAAPVAPTPPRASTNAAPAAPTPAAK
jgi:soluble cytochrome b562